MSSLLSTEFELTKTAKGLPRAQLPTPLRPMPGPFDLETSGDVAGRGDSQYPTYDFMGRGAVHIPADLR